MEGQQQPPGTRPCSRMVWMHWMGHPFQHRTAILQQGSIASITHRTNRINGLCMFLCCSIGCTAAKPFTLNPLTFRDIAGSGKGRAIPGVGLVADTAKDGPVGLLPAADGSHVRAGEVAATRYILVGCAWLPVSETEVVSSGVCLASSPVLQAGRLSSAAIG